MRYPQQNFLRALIKFVFGLEPSSVKIFHRSSFREVGEGNVLQVSQVAVGLGFSAGDQASGMFAGVAWLLTGEDTVQASAFL